MARLLTRVILLVTIVSAFGLFYVVSRTSSPPTASSSEDHLKNPQPLEIPLPKVKVVGISSRYEDTPQNEAKPVPKERYENVESAPQVSHVESNLPKDSSLVPQISKSDSLNRHHADSNKESYLAIKKKLMVHPEIPSAEPQEVIVQPKLVESKSASLTPPLKLDIQPRTAPNKRGVVFAVNYYEQQTMASRNMFQLQCWAKTLNLSVVQPATKDSFLQTPLNEGAWGSLLRLSDLYDINDWERTSQQYHYSSLIEWEEFQRVGPRNVILVSFNYPSVSHVKARQKAGGQVVHPPQGDRYKTGCDSKFSSKGVVLETRGFKVVRNVCFNFYHGDQLSLKEFNSHILGDYPSSEVTIVMEMWRGIGSGQRVLISDSHCAETYPIQELVTPSPRLIRDAETYVKTVLNGEPYLAIMGRFEMSLITVHVKQPVVPYCLRETLTQFQQFKKEAHLDNAFISIDIGKYGSKKWRKGAEADISREVLNLFHGVYGTDKSIKEWEEGFESISGTRDAGYIGLLQKVIVSRAQCVLFVGGGAFQRHALHLYRNLHRGSVCARVVQQCTSSSKFRL